MVYMAFPGPRALVKLPLGVLGMLGTWAAPEPDAAGAPEPDAAGGFVIFVGRLTGNEQGKRIVKPII